MDNVYRCMNCGNNIMASTDEGLSCDPCSKTDQFVQVTEENQATLPFPKHLKYAYIESEYDLNFCNDQEGTCPCGVFISHLINKTCDVIDTAVAKEPMYPTCPCSAGESPCGHSISHRVTDPCTGQQ